MYALVFGFLSYHRAKQMKLNESNNNKRGKKANSSNLIASLIIIRILNSKYGKLKMMNFLKSF